MAEPTTAPAHPVTDDGVLTEAGPELAQSLVVLLWASTFVVSKGIFAQLAPLPFTAVRFLLMTLLAFGVLLARRRGALPSIRRADLGRFLLVAFFGYVAYQLGFVFGLERTSPFSSSLLIAMVPLFTVLILAAMGERTPPRGWLGLAVAVVGVGVFLWDQRGDTGSLLGDALSLLAGVSFAAYGVFNRPLVGRYPSEVHSAYTTLFGAVPLILLALPTAVGTDWGAVSGPAWLAVVYMAIFPVYVAYQLWNWAIARRGVAAATTFSLLVPIVSGILSAIFYNEGFGVWKVMGATLVLTGLAIVRLRPGAIAGWRPRRGKGRGRG